MKRKHLSWAGFAVAGIAMYQIVVDLYSDWRQENQRRFDEAGATILQVAASLPVSKGTGWTPSETADGGWEAEVCWFDWGPHPPPEEFPEGASVVYGDGRKAWCWGFSTTIVDESSIVWESPRGTPGTCEKLQEFPEQWQPKGYDGCE